MWTVAFFFLIVVAIVTFFIVDADFQPKLEWLIRIQECKHYETIDDIPVNKMFTHSAII